MRVPRKPESQYSIELESTITPGTHHYNGIILQLLEENGHQETGVQTITLRNALIYLTVDAMSGSHPDLDIFEAVKYGVHYDPGCTDSWVEHGYEAWSDLELANAMAMFAMVRGRESKASRQQKGMAHVHYELMTREVGNHIDHPNAITTREIREAFYHLSK